MDDQLLLGASQARIDNNMSIFRAFGVDRLRVSAFWNQIAPDEDSRSRPAAFDASDPNEPRYRFAALDRVVDSAARHGLRIMVSISTPAPVWASRDPRRDNKLWKPSPAEFASFTEAVVRRYAPGGGPLGHLQRAQPGRLAAAPERPRGRGRPPPLPGAGPGRLPAHQGARPGLGRAGGRAGRQRAGRAGATSCRCARCASCARWPAATRATARSGAGGAGTSPPCRWTRSGTTPTSCCSRPACARGTETTPRSATAGASCGWSTASPSLGAFESGDGEPLSVYYTEFGYQTNPPDPFAGVSLSAAAALPPAGGLHRLGAPRGSAASTSSASRTAPSREADRSALRSFSPVCSFAIAGASPPTGPSPTRS